ncbi:MAG: aminotransferase class V-fold PLP-dependent enzyme, partial [Alphaproteobacteria bacterium]|nr:aminotransferase class V-fold PLP-dependent enzyme [Alphaproteobacteria bacterium]
MNDLATNKTRTVLDPQALRQRFPIYRNNPGLVFLDSGASAQKPDSVIDGVAEFYRRDYANVHRGVYQLSQRSTDAFEIGREKARAFLNAASAEEVIFVRGATEAINLVAQSWGPANVRAGDEIVVSDLEHHSNFVPWQMLCERVGARLVVAPTDASGGFDLAAFEALVSDRTKMVALTHVSNVTGTIVPVERVVELAHA